MRGLLVAVALVGVMASAGVAAPVGRSLARTQPSLTPVKAQGPTRLAPAPTVETLRASLLSRRAPAAKVTVPPGSFISQKAAARAMASKSYSQGSGVVLDVAHLEDQWTGSSMSLFGVMLTPYLASGIAKGERNLQVFASRRVEDGKTLADGRRGQVFADAVFENLPTGVHTYVITLGSFSSGAAPAILVNQSEWHVDDLVVNQEAHTAQLLVLVDGDKQDKLYLAFGAAFSGPASGQLDPMSVYYVQMALVQ